MLDIAHSIVLERTLRNITLSKLDLILSSGEGVRDTHPVGSLRKANLSHWVTYIEEGNTLSFRNVVFLSVL
jgi:hypothetical protein